MPVWLALVTLAISPAFAGEDAAGADASRETKQLLLLGQGPDGHPWGTHEYMAGTRVLAALLEPVEGLQVRRVRADEPWKEGPELLADADGVFVFLSQGARWLQREEARLKAFQRLARRGGGLSVLHWGMGTKQARDIDAFVELFGGCHGGPDRKYKVVEAETQIARPEHPVMRGLEPLRVKDEFYYTLKFVKPAGRVTPLLRVPIEGDSHTVAWAWERPDGGRSFGFSGAHYHRNWRLPEYRRMIAQGVLWTLKLPIPERGLSLDITEESLRIRRPKP